LEWQNWKIFVPTQRRRASVRSRPQTARQQFKNTHEKKTAPILIAEEIEFASSGGNGKQNSNSAATTPAYGGYGAPPAAAPTYSGQPQPQYGGYAPQPQPGNFTGYENFGGNNPYFPES
jgi:hypothetical protein